MSYFKLVLLIYVRQSDAMVVSATEIPAEIWSSRGQTGRERQRQRQRQNQRSERGRFPLHYFTAVEISVIQEPHSSGRDFLALDYTWLHLPVPGGMNKLCSKAHHNSKYWHTLQFYCSLKEELYWNRQKNRFSLTKL